MLLELNLKNFILIEDIRLSFSEGLNIVTGETGAGKSIILEGLRICLGNRTSKDYLRDPKEKATFEMIFSTPDDFFAITREIFPSGRAISRLNGDIVNVDQIQQTILPYLDIYGQRDHFRLLDPAHQQATIDAFDEAALQPIQARVEASLTAYRDARSKLRALDQLAKADVTRERQILKELEALHIDLELDLEREMQFERLNHLADILTGLTEASELLDRSILSDLDRLGRNISYLERFDETYAATASRIDGTRLELEDLAAELRRQRNALDLDEAELFALNERIEVLHRVKKTYQRDLEGLLDYQQELRTTIQAVESLQETRQALTEEMQAQLVAYDEHSKDLMLLRRDVFDRLKVELIGSLVRMELPDVALDLEQTAISGEPLTGGRYQAEILASMNNRQLRPMKDVLSGGEMSRFILALKQVFSRKEQTLAMVFDEIDTGISGKTAFEVGRNIKQLAQEKQVIAITHLPQLTAFADTHYQITKVEATTLVERLDAEDHVRRLAFMMSSSLSESAITSARELIARAEATT